MRHLLGSFPSSLDDWALLLFMVVMLGYFAVATWIDAISYVL